MSSWSVYKQEIASLYSRRSTSYDDSDWHAQMARQLVDFLNIKPDAQVLDVATGTGLVAFYVASKLGVGGTVLGVDISEGMLAQAREKLRTVPSAAVRFEWGDAESLEYAQGRFDVILCCSALIWMSDLPGVLRHWWSLLAPGGVIGFNAFSEQAFVIGVTAQAALKSLGVDYRMSQPTGSVGKCRHLLEAAGFQDVQVQVVPGGNYIGLDEAKSAWVTDAHPAPGQFPHPLTNLTAEQLAVARADYERRLEQLNTPGGLWNDTTTFYVYGTKPWA
ncbi:class I SAM-dependent methyltransferase [Halothiobacillus sp. DCM-1]|uniref:class I SAM-dependent methyltransferase n=1 Tax=Halothiobacillus sp. DCM-1 TaxID=3112558 RepID=UPI003245C385